MDGTSGPDYTDRLRRKQAVWWKRALPVQAPYRFNLRRQRLGRTLDLGCGIGRNLRVLDPGSLGVDHNVSAVSVARAAGLDALTTNELRTDPGPFQGAFDSMLVAHVIEHLTPADALELVREHLQFVRPGGHVFMVCPQERGFASDTTHMTFTDDADLVRLSRDLGLLPGKPFSFPFPRAAGRAFVYNEFCLLSRLPSVPAT